MDTTSLRNGGSAGAPATDGSRSGSVEGLIRRCGFCSFLSRLVRRAMCVGSRRGSGESYYQELPETNINDVATLETTDNSLYIRLIHPQLSHHRLSVDGTETKDSKMANTLFASGARNNYASSIGRPDMVDDQLSESGRPACWRRNAYNGRFLTMHKRRRKKLTTRGLSQDVAILDDILHGQVQCILNQVGNWKFNAFTLETVTGGRSLPVLCVHLFHWYGLLDHFKLDVVRVWKLFTLIEEGYHSTNPYHNSIHATDVTQAMHCFLQERKILEHLEPLEIMAALLGAVTHDLDHPGVNQPFLIATSNHLAALYENTSVLENHHWRSAVGCLLESGVAEQIHNIRPELEQQIASLILATDITRQHEFLKHFRAYLDNSTLNMQCATDRHFILQIALKCADISNPCRPWDISKKWSQKVCEEFFRQGDFERQLSLPITSLCDRLSTSVPKIQMGFFNFVVTPLFDEWHRFLHTDLSYRMMYFLKYNKSQWEAKVAAELAEETRTEISDADLLDDDIDEVAGETVVQTVSDSADVLLAEISLPRRSSLQVPHLMMHFDRRHSMPLNPPRIVLAPPDCNYTKPAIHEDIEHSSFSLLSSDSDSVPRMVSSGESSVERGRPLSAETLVADLSIATMTNSICANRLNMVIHGNSSNFLCTETNSVGIMSKHLIRQQTFPPVQPYVRPRYLSAASDLTSGGEGVQRPLIESGSTSSESQTDADQRGILVSKRESIKREQSAACLLGPDKSSKMGKFSSGTGQKENLDPTITRQLLYRRRGSAPVTIGVSQKNLADDSLSFVIQTCDHILRRGSMPAEAGSRTATSISNPASNLDSSSAALVYPPILLQRRGSVPCEVSSKSNGKSRIRKKLLRRRSSGGAEILSPILADPTESPTETGSKTMSAWLRFKRDISRASHRSDMDTLLTKRRGSLPVEVLSICHTGTLRN